MGTDEEVNRDPIWIVRGASGTDQMYRRLLRGPGEIGAVSETDLTLFHHPTFRIWYLRGIAGIRELPTPDARREALEFLVWLNTERGRRNAQLLALALPEITSAIARFRPNIQPARPGPVISGPALPAPPRAPAPRAIGVGAQGFRVTPELTRTARELVARIRSGTGRVTVNVGGNPNSFNGESHAAVNLNPLVSDIPRDPTSVPNLVRAPGEFMDEIFEQGSIDAVVSNNIEEGRILWSTAAPAAFRVLRPGGSIHIAPFGTNPEHVAEIRRAVEAAGFRDVRVFSNLVTGVK